MNQILIKFIHMLKIHMKQNIILIKKRESTGPQYCNDSKDVLNTQMKWMIFTKILKNTI